MTKENFMIVVNFIRNKVLSAKGIAIIVCIGSLLFAYNLIQNRVVPMSYGADANGPATSDLIGLALSGLTAVVSFVVSRYTGVKVSPEVIQAVVAFERDPKNVEAQRRVSAAVFGYVTEVLKQNPSSSGSFVLQLLTTLVGAIDDPILRNILANTAKNVSDNEFKPVPVPAPQ